MRPIRVNRKNKTARPADHSSVIFDRIVEGGKFISIKELVEKIFGVNATVKQTSVVKGAITKLKNARKIVRVKRTWGLQTWIKQTEDGSNNNS